MGASRGILGLKTREFDANSGQNLMLAAGGVERVNRIFRQESTIYPRMTTFGEVHAGRSSTWNLDLESRFTGGYVNWFEKERNGHRCSNRSNRILNVSVKAVEAVIPGQAGQAPTGDVRNVDQESIAALEFKDLIAVLYCEIGERCNAEIAQDRSEPRFQIFARVKTLAIGQDGGVGHQAR